jgi:hypothetical protein
LDALRSAVDNDAKYKRFEAEPVQSGQKRKMPGEFSRAKKKMRKRA